MNLKYILLAVFSVFFIGSAMAQMTYKEGSKQLTGSVRDSKNNEKLPGVTIYFPEIKTGTLTNEEGEFSLDELPNSKLLIQVSLIGYESVTQQVDLRETAQIDFKLEESITEIREVVITGQPGAIEQKRTPAPISVVPRTQLLESGSTNIIDALAKQPGISQITTGAGISKPVIRGLGFNRVIVMNDGIRQEGQQWGDEHGIEIDEYSVNHVEILKGPASLAYGSDAMAGVINMIGAPSLPSGSIQGNVLSNYQSNNGLIGYSANLAGNQNGFIWNARVSGKHSHDYQNSQDGFVPNSRFRENAASLMVGLNRSWGYSHLNFSLFEQQPGMVEAHHHEGEEEGHEEGEEEHEHEHDHEDEHGEKSYHMEVPFQKINHYKAVWNNKIYLGRGNLQTTLGFQQNRRKEFEEDAHDYSLYFKLNTVNYDAKYHLRLDNDWDITGGVGGMWQQSNNGGSEFLIPEYDLFDIGVYAIAHKQIGRFDFSGGLRYDHRSQDSDELYLDESGAVSDGSNPSDELYFSPFSKDLHGISGSIGLTYQISESAYTKLNLSRGYRAPNISELGSQGNHSGTYRYEIGNPNLKAETSWQVDWGIGWDSKHISAEANLFNNRVNNYIFAHQLANTAGADSIINDVPVFQYTGGDAHLYGGELKIDIHPHPLDFLHFENSFSYTRGSLDNQTDSTRNLPMIPAARWVSDLKLKAGKLTNWAQNAYISVGLDHNWAQNKIYSAYGTETATPAYTLFNLGAGTDINSNKRKICSFYVSVNNLTDKAYQNHLSRLKYAENEEANGYNGFYNMGRNISVKLLIPISIL